MDLLKSVIEYLVLHTSFITVFFEANISALENKQKNTFINSQKLLNY